MNPKIEEIARALCRAAGINPDSQLGFLNSDKAWERYVESARAAVTAMREPSEAVRDAGKMAHIFVNGRIPRVDAIWNAMIDEMLK